MKELSRVHFSEPLTPGLGGAVIGGFELWTFNNRGVIVVNGHWPLAALTCQITVKLYKLINYSMNKQFAELT